MFPKNAFLNWAKRTTFGRWALPARAARAAKFITISAIRAAKIRIVISPATAAALWKFGTLYLKVITAKRTGPLNLCPTTILIRVWVWNGYVWQCKMPKTCLKRTFSPRLSTAPNKICILRETPKKKFPPCALLRTT